MDAQFMFHTFNLLKKSYFAIRPTAQRICSILYSDHNIAYRVVFMSVGKCHRRSDLQCLVVRGSV